MNTTPSSAISGINDLPLTTHDDLLEVNDHVEALARFIQCCQPPMTIAIQGDWGSGKTSVMHLVNLKLEKNVARVFFNTWTLSQFNLGDQLVVTLMLQILNELNRLDNDGTADDDEKSARVRKYLRVLQSFGKSAVQEALKLVPYGDSINKAAVDAIKEYRAAEEQVSTETKTDLESAIDALSKLRDALQDKVDAICDPKEGKYSRIVFFIDDLDRLEPGRAVELMEGMKNFLDLENCVFVLAVDFNVVVKGVNSKYSDIDDAKARAFFDKIIQVPFRMPVDEYKITKLISKFFPEEQEDQVDELYSRILSASVGSNPRSIKRVFNTFMLTKEISKIKGKKVVDQSEFSLYLFAGLCLQSGLPEFEIAFRNIVSGGSPISFLKKISDGDYSDLDQELTASPNLGSFQDFSNLIASRVEEDKTRLQLLRNALLCTETTAIDSARKVRLVGTQQYSSNELKKALESGEFEGKVLNPIFARYVKRLSELDEHSCFTWALRPKPENPKCVAIRVVTNDTKRAEKEVLFTTSSAFNPANDEINFTLPLLKGVNNIGAGRKILNDFNIEQKGRLQTNQLIDFDTNDGRPKMHLKSDNAEDLATLTHMLLKAKLDDMKLVFRSFEDWMTENTK